MNVLNDGTELNRDRNIIGDVIEENDCRDFIPLYPYYDESNAIYVERLEKTLEDDEILNIGLTGPYGSGKSSILKEFVNRVSKKSKTLTISLASFEGKGIDRNGDNKNDDNDIEIGILQQLIYKVNPKKIPLSRMIRIKEEYEWAFSLIFSIIIYITSSSVLNQTVRYFVDLFLKFGIPVKYDLFMECMLHMISFVAIFIGVGIILRKFNINTISFKGIDLTAPEEKCSVLNKYLDEIIYILKRSKVRIVIFEDIDRFNNKEIFYKLRELNIILNDNEKIKKQGKIKFIYAIRDEMLPKSEERTKFFDFILPVVPVISNNNAQFKFIETLNKLGLKNKISENVIQDMSYFVKDMRLVINICNEFKLYYEKIYNTLNKDNNASYSIDKLFVIVVYKNLYAYDFKNMQYDNGNINKLIELKKDIKKHYEKQLENIIEKKNLDFSRIENDINEYEINLKREILNRYDMVAIRKNNWFYVGDEVYDNKESFYNDANIIEIFQNGIRGNFEQETKSISEIYPENNWKDNYENLKKEKEAEKLIINQCIESLEKRNPIKESLKEILSEDKEIIDIIAKEQSNSQIESILENNFFMFCVKKGYIGEDYIYYINNIYLDDLTIEEYNFIADIKLLKGIPKYLISIKNPKIVCSRLDATDFDDLGILNIDLLDYLLNEFSTPQKEIDIDEKLELMQKNIVKQLKKGGNFFVTCINNLKNSRLFLEQLIQKYPNIWNVIKENITDEIEIQNSALYFVRNLNANQIYSIINWQDIKETLERIETLEKISDLEKIENIFKKYNFLFKKISKYPREIVNYIISRKIYEINIANIDYILELFAIAEKNVLIPNKYFTLIMKIKNKSINKYVRDNIDKFIQNVILKIDSYMLTENELIEICNCNPGKECLRKLIEKCRIKVSRILNITNKKYWKILVELDSIDAKIENILYIFKELGMFVELETFINTNIKNIMQECKSKENILLQMNFKEFVEALFSGKEIKEMNLFKLLKIYIQFNFKIGDVKCENYPQNIIDYFVGKNLIMFNKINYLNIKEYANDKLYEFCQKNIREFLEYFEDLEDDISDKLIKKLICSNIALEDKNELLKNKAYNLDITEGNEADMILRVLNQYYDDYVEYFDYDFLYNLFKVSENYVLKTIILNKYIDKLDEDESFELLSTIYEENVLIESRRKLRINKKDRIIPILKKLRKKGFVRLDDDDDEYIVYRI